MRRTGRFAVTRCPECSTTYLPPRIYCRDCFADLSERLDAALGTDGHFSRLVGLVLRSQLPSWFQAYAEMEAKATYISTYQAQLVYGLLQTEEYAQLIRSLGAKNVVVTGSVKYDGACTNRDHPRTRAMRELFGIGQDLVLVAGSTQEPEESMILRTFAEARKRTPNLRLMLVPRQKDRFDQVAYLIHKSGLPFARRSDRIE